MNFHFKIINNYWRVVVWRFYVLVSYLTLKSIVRVFLCGRVKIRCIRSDPGLFREDRYPSWLKVGVPGPATRPWEFTLGDPFRPCQREVVSRLKLYLLCPSEGGGRGECTSVPHLPVPDSRRSTRCSWKTTRGRTLWRETPEPERFGRIKFKESSYLAQGMNR